MLTGKLLEAMGGEDVEVAKRSGDGGMDVTGELRSVGSLQQPVRVQSKRYKPTNTVGATAHANSAEYSATTGST